MSTRALYSSLYRSLALVRKVEETIAEKYSEQEMRCPVHLSIGQEAIAVGVCANLKKSDLVYSNHRCHAHYVAKGGDLRRMIAEIYGRSTGCCGGKGGSMHLIDLSVGFGGATPIVSNSIPVAVGAALASKMKKDKKVTVIFLGDGAMEEGVAHESLNFAALHNLPILFVCENNLFSVYTHLNTRQPKRPIWKLAQAHGVRASGYDGSDVRKVYEVVKNLVADIRKGNGPAFVEFSTYRFREHCGPGFDDGLNYRSPKEVAFWKKKDPLVLFEKTLAKNGTLSVKAKKQIEDSITKQVEDAFTFAKNSPFPKKKELSIGLYA